MILRGSRAPGVGITPIPPIAAAATGVVAQLRSTLAGTLTWSKLSGDASISVAAGGAVSLSAGLAAGASLTLGVRVQNTDGDAIERGLTLRAVGGGGVPGTPLTKPVLSNPDDFVSGTNPPDWKTTLTDPITYDPDTGEGDQVRMRYRLGGGAWVVSAWEPLDEEFVTGVLVWAALASPLAARPFEAQVEHGRDIGLPTEQLSGWSNSWSDTLVALPLFAPSSSGLYDDELAFPTVVTQDFAFGAGVRLVVAAEEFSRVINGVTVEGDAASQLAKVGILSAYWEAGGPAATDTVAMTFAVGVRNIGIVCFSSDDVDTPGTVVTTADAFGRATETAGAMDVPDGGLVLVIVASMGKTVASWSDGATVLPSESWFVDSQADTQHLAFALFHADTTPTATFNQSSGRSQLIAIPWSTTP